MDGFLATIEQGDTATVAFPYGTPPAPGLIPAGTKAQFSKAGAVLVLSTNDIVDIGAGYYSLVLSSSDTEVAGPLLMVVQAGVIAASHFSITITTNQAMLTSTLKTRMPPLLQSVSSQQTRATDTILSAIKNHGASNLHTLRRILGK